MLNKGNPAPRRPWHRRISSSLNVKDLTVKYLMDFTENARADDLKEVFLSDGRSFQEEPLAELLAANAQALVDSKTDKVYGIGGINGHVVWLLCTHEVEKNKIKFLRFMKALLEVKLEECHFLMNKAWKGNELHIKWLTWLGAEWNEDVISPPDFIYFSFKSYKGGFPRV